MGSVKSDPKCTHSTQRLEMPKRLPERHPGITFNADSVVTEILTGNERRIKVALCGRCNSEINAIQTAFKRRHGGDLSDFTAKSLSETFDWIAESKEMSYGKDGPFLINTARKRSDYLPQRSAKNPQHQRLLDAVVKAYNRSYKIFISLSDSQVSGLDLIGSYPLGDQALDLKPDVARAKEELAKVLKSTKDSSLFMSLTALNGDLDVLERLAESPHISCRPEIITTSHRTPNGAYIETSKAFGRLRAFVGLEQF